DEGGEDGSNRSRDRGRGAVVPADPALDADQYRRDRRDALRHPLVARALEADGDTGDRGERGRHRSLLPHPGAAPPAGRAARRATVRRASPTTPGAASRGPASAIARAAGTGSRTSAGTTFRSSATGTRPPIGPGSSGATPAGSRSGTSTTRRRARRAVRSACG